MLISITLGPLDGVNEMPRRDSSMPSFFLKPPAPPSTNHWFYVNLTSSEDFDNMFKINYYRVNKFSS